jgi:predicted  nucleic acid-binding Zn-ribbon protein
MAEEPENLTLVFLRRMDIKLDRIIDDLQDLKVRVTNLEENMAGMNRRMDRIEVRLDRMERRLDLIEPAHGT